MGSKYLLKSTISLCSLIRGDCKFLKRFTVPGGHHRGFSFGSKYSSSASSSSTASALTAVALALPGSFRIGAASRYEKSMTSSPSPPRVTGNARTAALSPPIRD